jgi:rubrerythrin
MLKEQIRVEGQLMALYEKAVRETENKPIQYMFRMIEMDSRKHIEMLQSALEIIEGQDVLIQDRKSLKTNLDEYLRLEKESIEKGNKLLGYRWFLDRKGLRSLIENWRDDEQRHHKFLKELSEKAYIPISIDDLLTVFRDEEFLEKRYLQTKKYAEKG